MSGSGSGSGGGGEADEGNDEHDAPALPTFRVHLSLLQSSATPPERIIPHHLFDGHLPAAAPIPEGSLASADDALALRLRKEPADVDQRLGPISLDWADNDSLHAMYAAHAQTRPPYDRTPSHLKPGHQINEHEKQPDDRAARRPGQDPTSSTPPSSIIPAPSTSATVAPSTSATPLVTQPIPAQDAPIPVAKYTQQSTFSTADDGDDADGSNDANAPRPGAALAQAGSSTYSIGRTHVAFGIVHLFRDQTEADQAEALEQQAPFPALEPAGKPGSSSTANPNDGRSAAEAGLSPPDSIQVTSEDEAGSILGILAVPGYMTAADFLAFIEPAADAISHIRMIRELKTEKCMVLIKFRDAFDAEEFHKMFNGQPFNAINEDELCQVVYITSVTISSSYTLPHAYPLLANSDPWPMLPPALSKGPPTEAASSSSQTGSATEQRLAAQLTYELPTCPVCLERMDSNITGLMTVTCQHTFHCSCLSKWTDSRCPVCRYSQTRHRNGALGLTLTAAQSRCTICKTSSDLWVCLICASVGCGRYKAGHAHQHFQETGHLYSLELETQRVWDYAGDGYVHRLIQNKADGKLVELPSGSSAASTPARGGGARRASRGPLRSGLEDVSFSTSGSGGGGGGGKDKLALGTTSGSGGARSADEDDKVESLGLEYSYLIVSQLESQRAFYEDQVKRFQAELELAHSAAAQLRDAQRGSEAELVALRSRLEEMERLQAQLSTERARAEKRADKALEAARKHERELHTERAQSAGLLSNLSTLTSQRDALEKEVGTLRAELGEVRDELRDLMFFVSARDKIEAAAAAEAGGGEVGELRGGDVIAAPAPGRPAASSSRDGTATTSGSGSGSNKKKKKKAAKPPPALVAQLVAAQQQQQPQQQDTGQGRAAHDHAREKREAGEDATGSGTAASKDSVVETSEKG